MAPLCGVHIWGRYVEFTWLGFYDISHGKLKCPYVLVDLSHNTGNHLWFSESCHHSCVTDVQSTPLGLSIVIISTVGMRKPRAGAKRHRQEAAEAAFHPSPDTSWCLGQSSLLSINGLIPLSKQQVNQCRCNWGNCLRITWSLPRRFDHNMKPKQNKTNSSHLV